MVITYEEYLLLNESNNLKDLFDKIKSLPNESKKRILTYGIVSLLSLKPISTVMDIVHKTKLDNDSTKIIENVIKEKEKGVWKIGSEFVLSKKGWDHIKNEEKLRLTGYEIGDSKITIGWGHAEDKKTSKYKVGQKISEKEAMMLLTSDLKIAANGVRRMFQEWKDRNHKEILINQDMFDSLVSLSFNMGISGFRQSDVVKLIKNGEYYKAGKLINTTAINKNYPGLISRRKKESDMFLSSI